MYVNVETASDAETVPWMIQGNGDEPDGGGRL
jgi:hypothetical protein